MADDYIPRKDAKFRFWANTFVSTLLQDPARFAAVPAQANYLKLLLDEFDQALAIVSAESTRTRPSILRKNNARHALEWACRRYARQIKENLGVEDSDKIALGIRPINTARSEIKAPETWPVLHVIGVTPGQQFLRYQDAATGRGAKPYGVSDLLLFMALTDHRNAPRSEARFVGKFTRNPIVIPFKQEQDGLVATYYGQWATERGETGPFSLPASLRIAA